MTSRHLVTFVGAALLCSMTSSASAQSKWWNTERLTRELGLTADQSQQLEQIYQATVPKLRAAKKDPTMRRAVVAEQKLREST